MNNLYYGCSFFFERNLYLCSLPPCSNPFPGRRLSSRLCSTPLHWRAPPHDIHTGTRHTGALPCSSTAIASALVRGDPAVHVGGQGRTRLTPSPQMRPAEERWQRIMMARWTALPAPATASEHQQRLHSTAIRPRRGAWKSPIIAAFSRPPRAISIRLELSCSSAAQHSAMPPAQANCATRQQEIAAGKVGRQRQAGGSGSG